MLPGMPRKRHRLILAVASAWLALSAASVAPAVRTGSAAPALSFSTPTIVDPFRQGFEPNVAIANATGPLCSSVPTAPPGPSPLGRPHAGAHPAPLGHTTSRTH